MNRSETRKRQANLAVGLIRYLTIILLANLIGELGILYFAVAVECYLLLQSLLTDFIPDYMGRMIRSRMGKGQYKNADKVLKASLVYGFVVGILGTVILFVSSDLIANNLLKMPEASLALKIIAPAFFLQAICAVLKGLFQGLGTNIPTVVAGLLSQIFGVFFILLFAGMLLTYGEKVAALLQNTKFASMYGAAGAVIGVPISIVFALAFLILMYFGAGRKRLKKKKEGMRLTEDGIDVLRMLLTSVLPMAAIRFCLRLPVLSGIAVFTRQTQGNIEAMSDYGTLYGTTFVVIGIFIALAMILCAGAENNIIYAVKREEYKTAKSYVAGGVQGIFMLSSFLTVLCLVFAPGILKVMNNHTVSANAISTLQVASPLILFMPLSLFLSRVLAGIGRKYTVLAGAAVSYLSCILVMIVAGNSNIGDIRIILYAFLVFSIVFCIWNGGFLLWLLRLNLPWLTAVGLPVLCAGITGLGLYMLEKILGNTVGEVIIFFIGTVLGGLVYMVLLFVLRCIRPKELYAIPGGKLLGKIGNILHLF